MILKCSECNAPSFHYLGFNGVIICINCGIHGYLYNNIFMPKRFDWHLKFIKDRTYYICSDKCNKSLHMELLLK